MANAKSVFQYEQPRCPDGWGESERRFYARLIQVLDDIYSKYGNIDEKLLSKKFVKSLEFQFGETMNEAQNASAAASDVENRLREEMNARTRISADGTGLSVGLVINDRLENDVLVRPTSVDIRHNETVVARFDAGVRLDHMRIVSDYGGLAVFYDPTPM